MNFEKAFEIFQQRKRCDLCLKAEDEQCRRCRNRRDIQYKDLQAAYTIIEKVLIEGKK